MTFFLRLSSLFALVLLVSCVETKASTVQSNEIEEKVIDAKEIASCTVNGVDVTIREFSDKYVYLEAVTVNNRQTVKLPVDSLNDFPTIELQCLENGFDLTYTYEMGNSYQTFIHSFVADDNTLFSLVSSFSKTSDRNGISISGTVLDKQLALIDYPEFSPPQETEIYSFMGFQSGEEPSITPFFEKVEKAKADKEALALFANTAVVDFVLENIEITESSIAEFNDVGYYFEQNGFYSAAIALLNEVISVNPKRTVAYINLGDAYWKNGQQEQGKKAYAKYLEQMTQKGLESRIPERVRVRLPN